MKKATLEAIRTVLLETIPDTDPMIVELDAEINKGAEEKAARAKAYEGIHDIIVDNLTETPITCGELLAEIETDVAAKGMTRYNVQYALNSLWQDEILKVPGKPNKYARKP